MALRMLCSVIGNSIIVGNKFIYEINPCLGSLSGLVHTRHKRNTPKRRVTQPMWYWMKKERSHFDEHITDENKEFIQEVIKQKYLEPGESPLKVQQAENKEEWTPETYRTGVIAKKIGIYPMWTKTGRRILMTLLQVVDNHVIRYYSPEEYATSRFGHLLHGKLGALVVGAESTDPQQFTAAYSGLFKESGVMPKKKLTRFFVTANAALLPGTPLYASHFRVGDYVDVYGVTRDHGFQGVVKRWGMKGGPKSHGTTKSHRRLGAIGGGRKKAGIWKGKKMPGHMGSERRIMRGLRVWRINTKYNVLWVHGPAVPGINNNYCYIMDCRMHKKKLTVDNPPPFPTYFPNEMEPLAEELYDPNLHLFDDPTITFEEEEKKTAVIKKKK